jgi:hypothetical protein
VLFTVQKPESLELEMILVGREKLSIQFKHVLYKYKYI